MPRQLPKVPPYDHDHENEVTLFAMTNFRNQMRKFGIKTDDRRRHTYVIGKTGMGKTTMLENMVLSDIYAGHGVAYIDPHGDTAQKLLDFIPPHRINDVVYFNPADMSFPIGFNIFETVDESQKHLVASGLMGVFKKIWPDVWSARMEYILLNTILALLDMPGSTLLGINRLLVDEEYRKRVISVCQDPVVKTFWVKEFAAFSEKYRTEAIAPVQNKVGQFLSASIIRNIVAQVKSTIDMRDIMDSRKIFIVNLSKGLVGEENSRLLGAMIITRLQLAAMERVDIPKEEDRQDFYLYVDEFQNFATESFASILSEARKYRLNLTVAHQYIEQLDETVRAAIFGNVGTIISFRVGAADADFMENEFAPTFLPEDLVNLKKFEIYLKLMINGAASEPFSAATLPPIAQRTGSTDKVVKVSRERYAMPREKIEEKVIRWSGMGTTDEGGKIMTDEESVEASETGAVDVDNDALADGDGDIETKMAELAKTSPDVGPMATPQPAYGQKKKKKEAKYEIPCSVCGEIQKLTFEPDYSRPWYCKNHLDQKEKDAAKPPSRRSTHDGDDRNKRPPRRERPAPPPIAGGSAPVLKADPKEEGISLSSLLGGAEEKKPEGGANGSGDKRDDADAGRKEHRASSVPAPSEERKMPHAEPRSPHDRPRERREENGTDAVLPSHPSVDAPRPAEARVSTPTTGADDGERKKKRRKRKKKHTDGADAPRPSDGDTGRPSGPSFRGPLEEKGSPNGPGSDEKRPPAPSFSPVKDAGRQEPPPPAPTPPPKKEPGPPPAGPRPEPPSSGGGGPAPLKPGQVIKF